MSKNKRWKRNRVLPPGVELLPKAMSAKIEPTGVPTVLGMVRMLFASHRDRVALVRKNSPEACTQIFVLLNSERAIAEVGAALVPVFRKHQNTKAKEDGLSFTFNGEHELKPLFEWMDYEELNFSYSPIDLEGMPPLRRKAIGISIRGVSICEEARAVLESAGVTVNL